VSPDGTGIGDGSGSGASNVVQITAPRAAALPTPASRCIWPTRAPRQVTGPDRADRRIVRNLQRRSAP
jgi:hypothetical protein